MLFGLDLRGLSGVRIMLNGREDVETTLTWRVRPPCMLRAQAQDFNFKVQLRSTSQQKMQQIPRTPCW